MPHCNLVAMLGDGFIGKHHKLSHRGFLRQFICAITLAVLLCSNVFAPKIFAADFDQLNSKLRAKYTDIDIIGVDEAYQIIHKDAAGEFALIIDARTAKEFAVSHIQGAVNAANAQDAAALLTSLLGDDKSSRILVYCSLGYRSGDLVRKLQENGYTEIINMEGSLFEWVDKGYPVFQGELSVNKVHPYNRWWGRHLRADYRSYSP